MRLKGKRAVITGASSGIGKAIAVAFARAGADVMINYATSQNAALAVAQNLREGGAVALTARADISREDQVGELVEAAVSGLGGIDIWANIAGADILTGVNSQASHSEKLARLIDVDLRGTMLCSWAAGAVMQAAGSGVILNMSWDLALVGMGERNPEMLAATKAGVSGFTRALARTLAPEVRVNEVAPGWIATAFAEHEMPEDYRQWVVQQTPMGRFGVPEDVAAAAVFLCSDDAAFITGQTLKVNGGLSS